MKKQTAHYVIRFKAVNVGYESFTSLTALFTHYDAEFIGASKFKLDRLTKENGQVFFETDNIEIVFLRSKTKTDVELSNFL